MRLTYENKMTASSYPLTEIVTAKVSVYSETPKLANIRIVLLQESFGEENVFYPAQDVTIFGVGIAKLRDILNSLPPE